ncbi:hypothetical protein RFI_18225, partial [Reticulomyxa filosa]
KKKKKKKNDWFEFDKKKKKVLNEKSERKVRLPIFCSRTAALPFTKIGLYIYEPMYRIMTDRILRMDRLFVISYNRGNPRRNTLESGNSIPINNISGNVEQRNVPILFQSYAEHAYESLLHNYRRCFPPKSNASEGNRNSNDNGNGNSNSNSNGSGHLNESSTDGNNG